VLGVPVAGCDTGRKCYRDTSSHLIRCGSSFTIEATNKTLGCGLELMEVMELIS
jgi:hypothetical protein